MSSFFGFFRNPQTSSYSADPSSLFTQTVFLCQWGVCSPGSQMWPSEGLPRWLRWKRLWWDLQNVLSKLHKLHYPKHHEPLQMMYFHHASPSFPAVDCIMSSWTVWSSCSVSCGRGSLFRQRDILREAMPGGSCGGAQFDSRACFPRACQGGFMNFSKTSVL